MSTPPRSVLVTAATSGIGMSICRRFAENGFHVFAHARDKERGTEVVKSVVDAGGSAELIVQDLLNDGAASSVLQQTVNGPKLEVIVNNAGGPIGENSFKRGEVNNPENIYRLNVFVPYELSVLGAEQ